MDKGEIWLIELDGNAAPSSRRLHPAVIVNENSLSNLPLRVIVPLADWKEIYARSPWMVRILPNGGNGLTRVSVADAFQVRSISRERFAHRIGRLNEKTIQEIAQAVGLVVGAK
ncbi:MAG: type II toxin-antitoxin system PemK/MazF family toxin [Anaerolineales bacterium]|nr:type II toxin-antitoxin system PemK/MazF family toxin [Anaerolineales bacterium]